MRFFVLIMMLLCAATAWAVEPDLYRGRGNDGKIWCEFTGPITKAAYPRFEKLLKPGCETLYLNSLGGDVTTSLAMGRLVRKNEMAVLVTSEAKCASACVFVYIGGVTRVPYTALQIHRPYFVDSTKEFAETQRMYHEIERQVKSYLREMNASERLFDDMMLPRIPASRTDWTR